MNHLTAFRRAGGHRSSEPVLKHIGLIVGLSLLLLPGISYADGTIVNTSVEFNIGNIYQNNGGNVNGQDAKFSQVCRYNGSTFVI